MQLFGGITDLQIPLSSNPGKGAVRSHQYWIRRWQWFAGNCGNGSMPHATWCSVPPQLLSWLAPHNPSSGRRTAPGSEACRRGSRLSRKRSLTSGLAATDTTKALFVPIAPHGHDGAVHDRCIAGAAPGGVVTQVAFAANYIVLDRIEPARLHHLLAVPAREMVRMIGLAHAAYGPWLNLLVTLAADRDGHTFFGRIARTRVGRINIPIKLGILNKK